MKPSVIIYNAISLDGRIDWFQADVGLFYQIASQWNEGATLCGCDTLLSVPDEIPDEAKDDKNPLEIRTDDKRPILVVPDSRGRLRTWHYWKQQPYWSDFVALCTKSTPKDYLAYLQDRHIKCIIAGNNKVDFKQALDELNATFGVKIVRVDSGGTLNGVLLREGLVDEVSLLVHPVLVGGKSSKSFFRAPDLISPEGVVSLRLKAVEQQQKGLLLLTYDVIQ